MHSDDRAFHNRRTRNGVPFFVFVHNFFFDFEIAINCKVLEQQKKIERKTIHQVEREKKKGDKKERKLKANLHCTESRRWSEANVSKNRWREMQFLVVYVQSGVDVGGAVRPWRRSCSGAGAWNGGWSACRGARGRAAATARRWKPAASCWTRAAAPSAVPRDCTDEAARSRNGTASGAADAGAGWSICSFDTSGSLSSSSSVPCFCDPVLSPWMTSLSMMLMLRQISANLNSSFLVCTLNFEWKVLEKSIYKGVILIKYFLEVSFEEYFHEVLFRSTVDKYFYDVLVGSSFYNNTC